MDLSESRYLRFHDDSSATMHRFLDQVPPGSLPSETEQQSSLPIIFGMIVLFLFVCVAANMSCRCGHSRSNETSDDPSALASPDPKRREAIEANLFSGKVDATLQAGSNTSSAIVFQPRQPAKDEECSICCNHFFSDEAFCIVKSCNHLFHKACIEQWIFDQRKDFCPVCRREVSGGGDGCKEIEMVSSQENNQPST
ncbi:unnamed protein product [Cylindrotheca closterium]|uniref:RING-type domain-containing protein n=1 Tax=Cylindrotheca closterium TaxID=2856 RepID=A0AAD2JIE5_9STRA|nr:unnamed protein product [Cylindrotheca closterium]